MNSHAMLLASMILLGIFGVSSTVALLNGSTSIMNFGSVVTFSPLHVEGRYIKDIRNQTVVLRGVNKVEFADQPGGTWMGQAVMGYSTWNPSNVRSELAAIRSWNITVIRAHQAVEHWKYDLGQHRRIFKEFLSLAAEYGIYVIYDGYSIRDYWNGGQQDPLPYPPYQTSSNASSVISNETEFVDWWVSVATELKSYTNVIFELWNEPEGDAQAKISWFGVMQRCIDAIRATGADQLIIPQWRTGCFVNLDFPPPNNGASTMDWVWEANLTDSLGNLVYSTHLYRSGGAFHHSLPTYWNAWNRSEIDTAFRYFRLYELAANHPVIVGEIGANIGFSGKELSNELEAFGVCLDLFNENGVHYAVFWWRNIGVFPLHNGPPNFSPNAAAEILKSHLLSG
jgi:hypothetical protein